MAPLGHFDTHGFDSKKCKAVDDRQRSQVYGARDTNHGLNIAHSLLGCNNLPQMVFIQSLCEIDIHQSQSLGYPYELGMGHLQDVEREHERARNGVRGLRCNGFDVMTNSGVGHSPEIVRLMETVNPCHYDVRKLRAQ